MLPPPELEFTSGLIPTYMRIGLAIASATGRGRILRDLKQQNTVGQDNVTNRATHHIFYAHPNRAHLIEAGSLIVIE